MENTLGQKIRKARQKKRWTQARLAHEIGVHQSLISRLERGGRDIPSSKMLVLLERLGLSGIETRPTVSGHEVLRSIDSAWSQYNRARTAYEALLESAKEMADLIRKHRIGISGDTTTTKPWDRVSIEQFAKQSPPPAETLSNYRQFHPRLVPDPRYLHALSELTSAAAKLKMEDLLTLTAIARRLGRSHDDSEQPNA